MLHLRIIVGQKTTKKNKLRMFVVGFSVSCSFTFFEINPLNCGTDRQLFLKWTTVPWRKTTSLRVFCKALIPYCTVEEHEENAWWERERQALCTCQEQCTCAAHGQVCQVRSEAGTWDASSSRTLPWRWSWSGFLNMFDCSLFDGRIERGWRRRSIRRRSSAIN